MHNNRLDIIIDGLSKGGAETLLLSMLPVFKKKFHSINIHYLSKNMPYSGDFEVFAKLVPLSVWELLIFLLRTRNRIIHVSLYKSVLIVNLLLFFWTKGKCFLLS